MAACKGLDRGQERRSRGFGEDSTMAQRLPGGLDDGMGPGDVDDSVSESLRGLEFAKATQWFIYRGATVATCITDIIGVVATENHNSDGLLPLLDCC
jgi:hypothetical protein